MTTKTSDVSTDLSLQPKDVVFVTQETYTSSIYHIHIDEQIGELDYFRPLQHLFSSATENDDFIIHLSCRGGDANTATVILGWMQITDAAVTVILEGLSASAASFFVMKADNVIVMPHSCLMIHQPSYGYWDDQSKVRKYVDFTDEHLKKFYEDIYSGFLSPGEIDSLFSSSQEIWLSADEVVERLDKRNAKKGEDKGVAIGDEENLKELESCSPKPKMRKKKEEIDD